MNRPPRWGYGREVTSPQSRRQARCADTVDWGQPQMGSQIDNPMLTQSQMTQNRESGRVAQAAEQTGCRRQRGGFINFHEPAVVDHVGGHNGGEAAFHCGVPRQL